MTEKLTFSIHTNDQTEDSANSKSARREICTLRQFKNICEARTRLGNVALVQKKIFFGGHKCTFYITKNNNKIINGLKIKYSIM